MTQGSEIGHIVRFSLPLLVGNVFQQLYNVVDSIVVGKHLGADAIAAIGATGSVTYLFYALCLGLSIGAGVLIAQFFGAGNEAGYKAAIVNSAFVTGVFGILISLLSVFFTHPILQALRTPDALIESSAQFMHITCGGTIAVAAYNWIASAMRAFGDAKTPLFFLMLASVLNVILELLFVIVLDFSVAGAAWGTVLSQTVSAAASIIYAFTKNPHFKLTAAHLKIEKPYALRCMKMGLPIAAQNALIAVSMVMLQRVTNGFGETVMAAYTVSMRIEQFVQQPFASLNAAISAFVAQNIGAREVKRAVKGFHAGFAISAGIAVTVMTVFLLLANHLVGIFVSDPDVIRIGAGALRMTACFYLFLGAIHTTRGFLNGAGDTSYALINGFVEVVGRVGFSLLLVHIPAFGFWTVWTTTCITWVLTAGMSMLRYKQKKWLGKCATE
ncbi:MAG: MATE family efflux transporter [Oscillospiraceae bacterium]